MASGRRPLAPEAPGGYGNQGFVRLFGALLLGAGGGQGADAQAGGGRFSPPAFRGAGAMRRGGDRHGRRRAELGGFAAGNSQFFVVQDAAMGNDGAVALGGGGPEEAGLGGAGRPGTAISEERKVVGGGLFRKRPPQLGTNVNLGQGRLRALFGRTKP